jgi:hypothetical protein
LTSPLVASVSFAAKEGGNFWKDRKDIHFGETSKTIAAIAKDGSCDYKSIFSKYGQKDLKEYLGELRKHFDRFKEIWGRMTDPNATIDEGFKASKERLRQEETEAAAIQCEKCDLKSSAVSKLPISEIMSALHQDTYLNFLKDLFKRACGKITIDVSKTPSAVQHSIIEFSGKPPVGELKKLINQKLNSKNPQPIQISYCSGILHDKSYTGLTPDGEYRCRSTHSSLIIGQRPARGGGCEFLIRNSYGSSCKPYKPWQCERGQIWVEAEALTKNIGSASWLEDK